MKNTTSRVLIGIVAIAFLGVGCSKKPPNVTTGLVAIPVKVQKVMAGNIVEPRHYVGTIVESQSVSLSFPVAGNVEQVLVNEGRHVKKGQCLAVLCRENCQNVLDAAKAKERQAQDAYDRLSRVHDNGSLPDVKMVEIETGLQQARATAQIAQKNLHDCALCAPSDGVIGKRMIEPGMNIVPENPVMTIIKIDKVFAKVSVPESEIAHTAIGMDAVVRIGALDNMTVLGRVAEKSVIADPLTRTYAVKIALGNTGYALMPGMACIVEIVKAKTESRIAVPQYAVINGIGEKYVYIADKNAARAVKRTVEVGTLCKDGVIITFGLQGGENLVVEGYHKLSDNSLITIE